MSAEQTTDGAVGVWSLDDLPPDHIDQVMRRHAREGVILSALSKRRRKKRLDLWCKQTSRLALPDGRDARFKSTDANYRVALGRAMKTRFFFSSRSDRGA